MKLKFASLDLVFFPRGQWFLFRREAPEQRFSAHVLRRENRGEMGNSHHSNASPREGKRNSEHHKHDTEDALVGLPLEVAQSFTEVHGSNHGIESKKGWQL